MALGWKGVGVLGSAFVFKTLLMSYSGALYAPTIGAYFRKYRDCVKNDMFEIKDAKKEYYYIDTSDYMNYGNKDLHDGYHSHHGP